MNFYYTKHHGSCSVLYTLTCSKWDMMGQDGVNTHSTVVCRWLHCENSEKIKKYIGCILISGIPADLRNEWSVTKATQSRKSRSTVWLKRRFFHTKPCAGVQTSGQRFFIVWCALTFTFLSIVCLIRRMNLPRFCQVLSSPPPLYYVERRLPSPWLSCWRTFLVVSYASS